MAVMAVLVGVMGSYEGRFCLASADALEFLTSTGLCLAVL